MATERSPSLDVAVVGGGPAGITACLELSKRSNLKTALFEGDTALGGMPRSCHVFFGMRDRKRVYSGPAYAKRLNSLIRKTGVNIYTEARVIDVFPGGRGDPHRIHVLSPQGLRSFGCRFLLLATGCFESPRPARGIAGTRPAGIFTTGALQELVNLRHLKPGRKAVIIGGEHVSFSSVLTLRRAGVSIAALVEEGPELQTYAYLSKVMGRFFGFPIYPNTKVKTILGNKRVEGIELWKDENQKRLKIDCDTIVITGKFRPESLLIHNSPIEQDPSTMGPVVDMNFMTSVPNVFAAGNLLRGADMHDLCALEGKLAASRIIGNLESQRVGTGLRIRVSVEPPIRYVVPQIILPHQIHRGPLSKFLPWPSIQVERTLRNPVIGAWSGGQMIWQKGYSKLLGHTRIPLPVEKFNWGRADPEKGVDLKVNGTSP